MSGHNYSESCPNCEKEMNSYSEKRPFSHIIHECLYCGLMVHPIISYMELDELNEWREHHDMEKLKELPKQISNVF